ncbi:zinc finger protein 346-like [Argiope bruennichi]|uniref:Zinc finger protein 346 like protein n=1 Tax=Argiope bruennichi TaxID=94029 RepID=A0A8T0EB64_ARGBR|nr:zinc finger protein 346-like [Argiope bruennichi]KAF8767435.1 Zinc finger protein 346 like protein [Argiope bruennichi]
MSTKDSAMETDSLLNKADTPAARKYQELFNDSDDDDSFPEIECDLCSKSFSNIKAYEQHVNSKKHHQMLSKKKLMKKIEPTEDEEDENVDPESTDELQCDVCEKTFSGYKPFVAHMRGGIHAKNMKKQKLKEFLKDKPEVLAKNDGEAESDDDDLLQKPFARCSVCEKVFYDPASYQKHMVGSTHKKKMTQQKTLDKLKNELRDDPQIEDEEFFTKCDICNKQFSGPVPYKIHLMSAVHENQMKRVRAMEKLKDFFLEDSTTGKMICKECKKMFTDPFAFKQHLDNNSHEKQKVKDKVLEFVAANPEIVAVKSVENITSEEDSEEKAGYEKGYYFLVCKLCHMSFTGLQSATDHVQSKKHVNARDEKKKIKLLKKRMTEKKNAQQSVNDSAKSAIEAPKSVTAISEMDTLDTDGNEEFELV